MEGHRRDKGPKKKLHDLRVILVAKCFGVSLNISQFRYFTTSQNILFRMFCEKQGCETNKFGETAALSACFSVS
jgi:hypothetical protein